MPQLTDRIDSFASDDPPPRRRYRLVLDLEADTLEELSSALTSIDRSLTVEQKPIEQSTCGGYGYGWHYELTDQGTEVSHDSWYAAATRWQARRRSIPMGSTDG